MATAAILKITLPVEPPLWERNFWFVTSDRKLNFVGVILTFKGSLLSRALMLNRFPQQIGQVRKQVEILVFFGPETSKKWIWSLQTPKRHVYETKHVVWVIKRANRLKIATCRRDEKTEKKIQQKGEQKSQKCNISPLCGGAPCELISTKFGLFVGLTNVITCAKIGFKISIGFSRPTGGKTHVSL